MLSSFLIGVKSASDVDPFERSSAQQAAIIRVPRAGDVNVDGIVDDLDVIEILEVAKGYKAPTTNMLAADPNHDGVLTVDDALQVLHSITLR